MKRLTILAPFAALYCARMGSGAQAPSAVAIRRRAGSCSSSAEADPWGGMVSGALEADLSVTQAARIHMVRVEFAWNSMELAKARLEFAWLLHAVAATPRRGLRWRRGAAASGSPLNAARTPADIF